MADPFQWARGYVLSTLKKLLGRLPSSNHWGWRILAGILGCLLSLPILSWPFGHDQAIFATIADSLLHGGVLYRDAWEHKGPGVFYSYYFAFLLLEHDLWAVHVAEILAMGLRS